MNDKITMRLLALLTLACAMLLPPASSAQLLDTNSVDQKIRTRREQLVSIGKDVELRADEAAGQAVVIGGKAIIHGKVEQDVVVIGGDALIDGPVEGQVVVILGDLLVSTNGKIDHDLVCIGGESRVAQGGKVGGQIVQMGAGVGPLQFLRLDWLKDWFLECVMKLRPLAPSVGWIWWIAAFFFMLYLLIAVLFPHPVQCCAAQMSARPATTFAVGVLAKMALPILCLMLPITIVGIFVVPFLVMAAFLTLLVGKAAVLEVIGGKLGGGFGFGEGKRPLIAFLIGAVLITILYLVPVIGLLTLCLFGCWGMGAGVTAACVAFRASRPPRPLIPVPTPAPPPATPSSLLGPPLAPPQALAYPRAGFWERMGAGFLDLALISLATAVCGPFAFLLALAYFSGMWAWKGTTVGGIVLNLQVVRQDGKPLNFLTSFVRSLAAVFSAVLLFLGFFWIGWDSDKQGWHDKIAGTVVVRLPRATSLVCI